MITMRDALRLVEERREDAIVIPTMMGGRAWSELSDDPSMDLPVSGGMSKTSSVALGLSLARPDKKVIIVDGDGSLLMNLGSLVTIAGKAPINLLHFVLDNGVYAVTGGQPTPNANGFSFAGLAKASGYASAFEFDDLEEFATSVDEIMNASGPVLVSIKTEPEIENEPIWARPRTTRRMPEAIKDLTQALNKLA
jgi:sulfopyruvate decarboxylase subunit beta